VIKPKEPSQNICSISANFFQFAPGSFLGQPRNATRTLELDTTPPPCTTLPEQIKGKPAIVGPAPKRPNPREKITCPTCGAKA
jgi:hypothetical protein